MAKPGTGPPSSLARPRARPPGPGGAAWLGLALAGLLGLALLLLSVMVVGSYLAPVFGRGWLWFGATLLVALGTPAVTGLWLVRPLEGFKRAAWLTGVCVLLPALAVIGLSIGAPDHTAGQLKKHGHWPFEQLFGPATRSSTTRLGESLAASWANLLHGEISTPKRAQRAAHREPPRARPKRPSRRVFFSGLKRARRRPGPSKPGRRPAARIPFAMRGREIMLRARITVGFRSRRVPMMLDTGASISTIDRATAAALGLRLPHTPVQVELQTAAGPRSFPVAVVDRLRLGRAGLRNVTVAICDPCAQPGLHGLVGLNFTRHFVTTIDHKKHLLTLRRQAGPANRISDAEPFLALSEVVGEIQGRRFSVTGKVRNRGPRPVRRLLLEAVLSDSGDRAIGRLKTTVDLVKPGRMRTFTLTGVGSRALVKYRLELRSARW